MNFRRYISHFRNCTVKIMKKSIALLENIYVHVFTYSLTTREREETLTRSRKEARLFRPSRFFRDNASFVTRYTWRSPRITRERSRGGRSDQTSNAEVASPTSAQQLVSNSLPTAKCISMEVRQASFTRRERGRARGAASRQMGNSVSRGREAADRRRRIN